MSTPNQQTSTTLDPNEQRANDLIAQFGHQGAALRELLMGAVAPLQTEVSKLRQENADLLTELATIKATGSVSLQPVDIAALGSAIASAVPLPTVPRDKLDAVTPDKFEGKPDQVDPFLSAARLYFALKPRAFSTERQKMLWVLTLFSGAAEPWARAKSELLLSNSLASLSATYDDLEKDIRISFSNVSRKEEARNNVQAMKFLAKDE